jgi:GT2 family glycosyltransferase
MNTAGLPGAARPRVSVIVVSYNTREMTLDCLRSVAAETDPGLFELIVVDNASSDGSAAAIAALPGVALTALGENIGFAAANNLAAGLARGDYLLLLNPDTVVLDRGIERLLDFAECRPDAGIWGGQTRFADGALNPASCWGRMTLWSLLCSATGFSALFRRSALFNPEGYGGWGRDAEREVDIVSGCFFLIRRELWNALGGFDLRFFMYAEEADLCQRAAARGARPRMTPEARIIHYGGASEPVRAPKTVRLLRGKATLLHKHWRPLPRRIGLALFDAMVLSRLGGYGLAAALTGRAAYRGRRDEWREVWRARPLWRAGYPLS